MDKEADEILNIGDSKVIKGLLVVIDDMECTEYCALSEFLMNFSFFMRQYYLSCERYR